MSGQGAFVIQLAVAPSRQRLRLGQAMMARAENAAVIAFYRGLGFAEDRVTVLGKRLIPDL